MFWIVLVILLHQHIRQDIRIVLKTTNHQKPILIVVSDVTVLQKDNDPVTIPFLGPCVDMLGSLWNIKIKL